MNQPKELMFVLGRNHLGFLLDQERKHWLLKTDKKKQTQDAVTGDIFQGQVDNLGSEIIIESEKLPYRSSILNEINFTPEQLNSVLSPAYSSFTHSSGVNGLMFARIESMTFPVITDTGEEYKNYKIEFTGCEECIIPFASSPMTSDVYATRWIKTTNKPTLLMMDEDGAYTIKQIINFDSDLGNIVYYYPLNTNMQTLKIHRTGAGIYSTDMITSNSYIGYPLFWFTCDKTNIGPTLTIAQNTSLQGKQLLHIANVGNESRYRAHLYAGIDGDMDATPNDDSTSNWKIRAFAATDTAFNNSDSDFDKPLNPELIDMYNNTTGDIFKFNIDASQVKDITMSRDVGWTYKSDDQYTIDLSVFDINCLKISDESIIPAFDVRFDETIPFYTSATKDLGSAGIRMSSALESDISRYPFSLNDWDGLPEWLRERSETGAPQHLVAYAIHNTPFYSPEVPESRQVAALLLDPGVQKTEDTEELSNEERGRVYVLSNDDPIYINNATTEYPKPARTVARICDIPTAVTDFMNVSGLVPVSVVDKEYVRSEASFTEADKDRIYNKLGNTIVRPYHMNVAGERICDIVESQEGNEYVFLSIEALEMVDLLKPANDLRIYTHLNPKIDPAKIKVSQINAPGAGYAENDHGIIIIGGCSLGYEITNVTPEGGVADLNIFPHDPEIFISASNFDMESDSGYTKPFGSSRSDGSGEGLKVSFYIEGYADVITRQDKIRDDLIAFVRTTEGLKMFKYAYNTSTQYGEGGEWVEYMTISQFEVSDPKTGVSTREAYLNTNIPSFKPITVMREEDDIADVTTIKTLSTGTFINIIDQDAVPISESGIVDDPDTRTRVDLCGFRCDGLIKDEAAYKETKEVINALDASGKVHHDCFVVWRWEDPEDSYNKKFEYGIFYRSLNNYFSDDVTTLIPKNSLRHPNYVNTNANTTVFWDVKDYGPMMWVFSPDYTRHEKYYFDAETREITINSNDDDMTFDEFRIKTSNNEYIDVVDSASGVFNFNILSNMASYNPTYKPESNAPIYQQPPLVEVAKAGTPSESAILKGNWKLMFPKVNMYRIVDQEKGIVHRSFKLRMLETIKGADIKNVTNVVDSAGHNINRKCVIIDESSTGMNMKMFNPKTGAWEVI